MIDIRWGALKDTSFFLQDTEQLITLEGLLSTLFSIHELIDPVIAYWQGACFHPTHPESTVNFG